MSYTTRTPAPRALGWLVAILVAAVAIGPFTFGFLASTLRGQAKDASTASGNVERPSITCTFADKKVPEGTVIQQGNGPEQMCVGVLAPLDLNDPDRPPRRVPQWIRTNSTIRQRSASVLHVPAPPPFSCKPKPSNSQSLCSCEDASPFGSGSLVDSANGALKCEQGKWRATTANELGTSD